MDFNKILDQLPAIKALVKSKADSDGEQLSSKVTTVIDPTTGKVARIDGTVVTAKGGIVAIDENTRPNIIASSNRQIYIARESANGPLILSAVQQIEAIVGKAIVKEFVDAGTIDALYREARVPLEEIKHKKTGDSNLQRQFIDLVREASKKYTSDIHITVRPDKTTVDFRVDGIMTPVRTMAVTVGDEMMAAVYSMMTDYSDTNYQARAFQSGVIQGTETSLPQGVQSLRLQFNPLAGSGRHMNARILYADSDRELSLEAVGYEPADRAKIQTIFARPTGISIFSGPTGSGKSTSLAAGLNDVFKRRTGPNGETEINLMTVEDPVEYRIGDGAARQMPVMAKKQEERSEAFTIAMSAALRSDPDWLMVGEIRDLATVELAVKQALAGAPTAASLHANSAMDILTRLVEMGLKTHLAYDDTVFSGLIGQRLVRKICPHCKVKMQEAIKTSDRIDEFLHGRVEKMIEASPDGWSIDDVYVSGPGCSECNLGYSGRTLVAEVIIPDARFMELMRAHNKVEARNYWFGHLDGFDLLGAGWKKVLNGEISPVELENSVALMRPSDAHVGAFERWIGPKV